MQRHAPDVQSDRTIHPDSEVKSGFGRIFLKVFKDILLQVSEPGGPLSDLKIYGPTIKAWERLPKN